MSRPRHDREAFGEDQPEHLERAEGASTASSAPRRSTLVVVQHAWKPLLAPPERRECAALVGCAPSSIVWSYRAVARHRGHRVEASCVSRTFLTRTRSSTPLGRLVIIAAQPDDGRAGARGSFAMCSAYMRPR